MLTYRRIFANTNRNLVVAQKANSAKEMGKAQKKSIEVRIFL